MSAVGERFAPPFRAEHIGSLIRPKALLDLRYAATRPDPEALRALEDEHIAAVIRWQEEIGLRSITDGEFRRESWRLGLVSKVAGFVRAAAIGDVDLQRDDAGNVARVGAAPYATARIRRSGPIVADEVAFAQRHARGTVKATLPAPSYLHYPRGNACAEPSVYPDIAEFFADVVEVYAAELAALHAAGGRYLQIDEVAQPVLCDANVRDAVRARGDDPDELIDLYIDLINRIARRRPPGMTLGVHMCRGNAMGKWIASGSYEAIAERTFNSLAVDAFFLEYDSARAGDFSPLRWLPAQKHVVLGLVSSKNAELESPDALRRRIDEAARHVPMERLALSPHCGFASVAGGNLLSEEDQAAKLRLVVDVARATWG